MKRYTRIWFKYIECAEGDVIKAKDFLEYEKKVQATYGRFGDDLAEVIELATSLKQENAELIKLMVHNKQELDRVCCANGIYFAALLIASTVALVALVAA